MKKLFTGILILSMVGCSLNSRDKNILPSFNLLLIDSITVFKTSNIPEGKPIILMYFSPDCEHCQKETEGILRNIDLLKNVLLYMVTTDPLDRLRAFNHHYHLEQYSNIVLAKDYKYELYNYLKPKQTPVIVIYDKIKELNSVYNGAPDINAFTKQIRAVL